MNLIRGIEKTKNTLEARVTHYNNKFENVSLGEKRRNEALAQAVAFQVALDILKYNTEEPDEDYFAE